MTQLERAKQNMQADKERLANAYKAKIEKYKNALTLPGTKGQKQVDRERKRYERLLKSNNSRFEGWTNEEIIKYYGDK